MRLLASLLVVLLIGAALLLGGSSSEDAAVQAPATGGSAASSGRATPELRLTATADGVPAPGGPAGTASFRAAVGSLPVTLDLRLVHAGTGAPLEDSVQVWRLDAPADDVWEAGDERVFVGPAPGGRVLLADLEPGTYRAWVGRARLSSDLPPPFELRSSPDGSPRVVTWPVVPAQDEPLWLVARDQDGQPVFELEAEVRGVRSTSKPRHLRLPPWARPRVTKADGWNGIPTQGYVQSRGSVVGLGEPAWRTPAAGIRGFALGEHQQASRMVERTLDLLVRRSAEPPVAVTIDLDGADRFLALVPDRAPILDPMTLPEGVTRETVRDELELEAAGVSLPEVGGELEAWRRATVRVRLALEGYVPLEATWRPAVEPAPLLALEPAPR